MNTFNLDQAEVAELKNHELAEVDGGIAPLLIIGGIFLIGVFVGAANEITKNDK